tara:strand:- start:745 stop:1575 length:831 start_codon:yes stop_codon:yes gene_type:complete
MIYNMDMDNLQHKTVNLLTTDEIEGKVEAVFSNFNEVDSDGDVVLAGSIKSGFGEKGVAMVWAHDWKDVVGRGEIIQDDEKAVFKGQFIMDTERGRDAFNTVKAMGELQQWSFGYEVLDAENGMFKKDGSENEIEVRFLKDVKVWEVSPVLVGANQNTYTMAVKDATAEDPNESDPIEEDNKGLRFDEEVDKVLNTLADLLKRSRELTALRLKKDKLLSEKVVDSLTELQDALQEVYQDVDTLLAVGSEEVVNDTDDTTLFIETEKVLLETMDEEL